MVPSLQPQNRRRLLYGLVVFIFTLAAWANIEVTTKTNSHEPELPKVSLIQHVEAAPSQPYPERPDPPSHKARNNPTYPDAPAPGTTYFRTLDFAELYSEKTSSPGTIAARDLLIRTHKGSVAAAEARYSGSAKGGFDEYQRAVFLNTVASILQRDARLLKNARFVRFYDGRKKRALEYGIVLSGLTAAELDDARMGLAGVLGMWGRRSPREESIASLQATPELKNPTFYSFDVDLYNPKSDPDKHKAEFDFNSLNIAATHPADVARALELRGIVSGVSTR
ncbi:MAG: hypothetical protein ACKVRN_07050 [Pyrinomonadaceae bacterium]